MIFNAQRGKKGFTMIELLVVMGIIAVLVSFSAPAIVGVMRSSRLTAASTQMVSQLASARQYAMANNCVVEMRFYQLPDTATPSTTPSIYRAYQNYALSSSGAAATPIGKINYFPDQIYMVNNTTVSSLLDTSAANPPPYYTTGTTAGTALGTFPPSSYNYIAFHFKPDGSTDLSPTATSGAAGRWFVSLANQHDQIQSATGLPNNFVTLQLDPLTGRVKYYRPN